MSKSYKVFWAVVLALCLLGAVACDSDNDGGGGATATSGYSLSDLAGRWKFVISGSSTGKGYMVIDESGRITEAVVKVFVAPGPWLIGKGAFTVTADGKVKGNFVYRVNYSPPANSYTLVLRGFRLRFISAAKVDGAYALAQEVYPGGVFGGRIKGPTNAITMEKQ